MFMHESIIIIVKSYPGKKRQALWKKKKWTLKSLKKKFLEILSGREKCLQMCKMFADVLRGRE